MIVITICLIAVGVSILVFLWALHGAAEGHEDEHGFHPDLKARAQARQVEAVRLSHLARARVSRATRASPWLQLPLHGQDEIELTVARMVVRSNSRSPI